MDAKELRIYGKEEEEEEEEAEEIEALGRSRPEKLFSRPVSQRTVPPSPPPLSTATTFLLGASRFFS